MLTVVGAGSGLPVPIPILSHSPSAIDNNASHIPSATNAPLVPSSSNAPPMPSTAATTAASDAMPAPKPNLGLTDLLHMPEVRLTTDVNFEFNFLNISNNMAALFPNMVGMPPSVPGHYRDVAGLSTVHALDLGLPALPRPTPSPTKSALTPLDINMGSKRTTAHLEEAYSRAPAKKQCKKCSNAGILCGPCK